MHTAAGVLPVARPGLCIVGCSRISGKVCLGERSLLLLKFEFESFVPVEGQILFLGFVKDGDDPLEGVCAQGRATLIRVTPD